MKIKFFKFMIYILSFIISVCFGMVFNHLDEYSCKYENTIPLSAPKATLEKIPVSSEPINSTTTININTSDINHLMLLEGIGEKTAQRIIEYRETNGSFEVIEDILKVPGIGEKTFKNIKDFISI